MGGVSGRWGVVGLALVVLQGSGCAKIQTRTRDEHRVLSSRRLPPRPIDEGGEVTVASVVRGDGLVLTLTAERTCVVPIVEQRQKVLVHERTGAEPAVFYELGVVGLSVVGAGLVLVDLPEPEEDKPAYCHDYPGAEGCEDPSDEGGPSREERENVAVGILVVGGLALGLAIIDGIRAADSEEILGVEEVEVEGERMACTDTVTDGRVTLSLQGQQFEGTWEGQEVVFRLTDERADRVAADPTAAVMLDGVPVGQVVVPDMPALAAARERLATRQAEAAERIALANSAFPELEREVNELVRARDWDDAIFAISSWRRTYGGTPASDRAHELAGEVERARRFDHMLGGGKARLLRRPRRMFATEDGVVVRSQPEEGSGTEAVLAFGQRMLVWSAPVRGWVLVAHADAERVNDLRNIVGWAPTRLLTRRNVMAEYERRREREARREEAQRRAEARRQARLEREVCRISAEFNASLERLGVYPRDALDLQRSILFVRWPVLLPQLANLSAMLANVEANPVTRAEAALGIVTGRMARHQKCLHPELTRLAIRTTSGEFVRTIDLEE